MGERLLMSMPSAIVELPTGTFRSPNYVERRVDVTERADGSLVLRNPHPLEDPFETVVAPIHHWADQRPETTWLAARGEDGAWRRLTYAEASERVRALGQALLDRGCGFAENLSAGETPKALMILSENSIEHALIMYAAMSIGMPVAPVSKSYSLMSTDFAKLKYVYDLIEPKIVFVQSGHQYQEALNQLDLKAVDVIYVQERPNAPSVVDFETLAGTLATRDVEEAVSNLTPRSVAKYLFTSGSTGMPKAVINTHRMLCINPKMIDAVTQRTDTDPHPVLTSWLPWNHTFGANSILNGALTRGASLYLDDGAPLPGQFEKTLRTLREISNTSYSNVPVAYSMLVPELEKDEALAETFFKDLRTLAYGGAAMGQDLYDRLQAVAMRTIGCKIPFSSGYGATETAPTIMNVHWVTERMGLIGLPLPGCEIKLVPHGEKLEVRVKGDCITPGYFKRPDLTEEAFDEEGFYKLGDAAKFVDPDDPVQGLVFDGRVKEDFKLETGTWVSAGALRVKAVAAAEGLLQDALVCGLDQPFVSLLGFPNFDACRALVGDTGLTHQELVRHPKILERLSDLYREYNKSNPGSSTRVKRVLLMEEPPNMDAGELTDKGYINQSTALDRRANLVDELYKDEPDSHVIIAG